MAAPPPAATSPIDRSGWVVIANALGLFVSLLALAVRAFIRTSISPPFSMDDRAAWIATALGIIQSSLTFRQLHEGFGKTIDNVPFENQEQIQKIGYTANPLYLATIYTAKCSMIFLLVRITPDRKLQRLLRIGLFACLVLVSTSILLVLLSCNLSSPWKHYGKKCEGLFARWQAVAVFDILSEIILFIAPNSFLVGLQMLVKQKAKVIFAFSMRLPIIAFAILRLLAIRNEINSSDPTLDGALASVWTQAGMHYALVSTTLPCLTPFLTTMNTNFGTLELETVNGTKGSSSGLPGSKSDIKVAASDATDNDKSEMATRSNRNSAKFQSKVFRGRRSMESSESTQIMTRES